MFWCVSGCCFSAFHFSNWELEQSTQFEHGVWYLICFRNLTIYSNKFFHYLWEFGLKIEFSGEKVTHFANVFSFHSSNHVKTWNNMHTCLRFGFSLDVLVFLCVVYIETIMSFNIQNIQVSGHAFDFHLVCFSFFKLYLYLFLLFLPSYTYMYWMMLMKNIECKQSSQLRIP